MQLTHRKIVGTLYWWFTLDDNNLRMKSQQKVQAIMNTELVDILKQTGQYEDVINGFVKCECCGREITLDNISTLIPFEQDGEIKIKFYCDHLDCVNCEK